MREWSKPYAKPIDRECLGLVVCCPSGLASQVAIAADQPAIAATAAQAAE